MFCFDLHIIDVLYKFASRMATKLLRLVADKKKVDGVDGGMFKHLLQYYNYLSIQNNIYIYIHPYNMYKVMCHFVNFLAVKRDVEMEDKMEELQDHVRELEKQNSHLKNKVQFLIVNCSKYEI